MIPLLLVALAHADDVDDYNRHTKSAPPPPPPVVVAAPAATPQAPAPVSEWERPFRRATTQARVGLWLGPAGAGTASVGLVTLLVGGFIQDEGIVWAGVGITAAGAGAVAVGPAVGASGSWRAARVLQAAGADVTPTLAGVTWGLWGGGIAAMLVGPAVGGDGGSLLTDAGGLAFIGSYGTTAGQLAANGDARRKLLNAAIPRPAAPPEGAPDTAPATEAPPPLPSAASEGARAPLPVVALGLSPVVLRGGGGLVLTGVF